MGFNPTSRRHYEIDEPELNLNPMMDLFGVLIPTMIMLSAAVEVSVINVVAPSIGGEPAPGTPPPKTDIPVNLTVTISDAGYTVTALGQVVAQLPLSERPIVCSRYRGTVPPPRSKNKDRPKCGEKEGQLKKTFLLYDNPALTAKVMDIKNEYPDERRVIVQPGPEVEYETIVDMLDAVRDVKSEKGGVKELFDEVVMSPGS